MAVRHLKVHVLRLGHRVVRDDRLTTHVCLTARAFGAEKVYVVGGEPWLRERMRDVCERWGGSFEVELVDEYRGLMRKWREDGGVVVHLTMYGEPVDEVLDRVREAGRILVVVGAEKVPREVFELSDFNVAIGNQPHSEVAALAVFLDRLFEGEELRREFTGGRLKILPSSRGKKVVAEKV